MTIRLQATLPPKQSRISYKSKGVKRNPRTRRAVVNAYFGLPEEMCKRLENRVKTSRKTRSHIVKEALDAYFLKVNKEPLEVHQICEKDPVIGLKTISVTIRQDQGDWLRMMSEKTGKKLSQLGREAMEFYLT